MPLITVEDIRKIVSSNNGGNFEELVGPHRCDHQRVWEVWVTKDGEYDTSFIVDSQEREPVYLHNFATLCEYIEKAFQQETATLKQQVSDLLIRHQELTSNRSDNKFKAREDPGGVSP